MFQCFISPSIIIESMQCEGVSVECIFVKREEEEKTSTQTYTNTHWLNEKTNQKRNEKLFYTKNKFSTRFHWCLFICLCISCSVTYIHSCMAYVLIKAFYSLICDSYKSVVILFIVVVVIVVVVVCLFLLLIVTHP